MSITGIMSSAVSALNANARVAATADNIVNLNVDGYKAKEVRTTTLVTEQTSNTLYTPGGVKIAVQEMGQVDLAHEFTNLMQAKFAYSVNVQVIETAEEMSDALLKIKA